MMTPDEKQLLDRIEKKLDLLLAPFGLAAQQRTTPREREEIAKEVVLRYRRRMELKSSSDKGKVVPISGKEIRKDGRAKSKRT